MSRNHRSTPPRSEIEEIVGLYRSRPAAEVLEAARRFSGRWPRTAIGWTLLALCSHGVNRPDEAHQAALRAVELDPDEPSSHSNLGVMQLALGRFEEARVSLSRALEIQPGNAQAHNNLGAALSGLGLTDEARASFRRATEIDPHYAEAHANLGGTLREQDRLVEAEGCFRRALAITPTYTAARAQLGGVLHDQGRLVEAERCFRELTTVEPGGFGHHNNLAVVLHDLGRFGEAEQSLQRAVTINPRSAEVHNNRGRALKELGRLDEARDCFRRALEINPDYAQAHSNLLFTLLHLDGVSAADCFAEHRRFGEHFEAQSRAHRSEYANPPEPERRLRVGFVSGDLRDHPVARFIEPVWAGLDRRRIESWVYSSHPAEDAVTARLRTRVAHWRRVAGLSDEALVERIRADGIDILIDLSGHTAYNRLPAFARKPAPLQATWIGYPGTTGLRAMDYLICDRFIAPHGLYERYFTEHFARLPSVGAFEPSDRAPPVNALPALERGYVTFASFNRPDKLGDAVVEGWSRVLRALPDARLLLGNVSDPSLSARLSKRFARHGVDGERLLFRPRVALEAYLALHHEVDIVLDSWPYTGGTTTHHALWMGVPVVTLRGPSRVQCQSAARLGWLGLEEWVADGVERFVEIAVDHATRLDELAALRAGMRERWARSPWRRHELVARGLEAALRAMWRRWCDGKGAADFEVALEALDGGRAPPTPPAPHIPLLRPCLPTAEALRPWLERIDETRRYSNFGPLVREFEAVLAGALAGPLEGVPMDRSGEPRVVTLHSGTAALELAVAALDLAPGGAVLMPALTFPATAGAVMRRGLTPLFADVDAWCWQLTPEIARGMAARAPLALVVPVAPFGVPVDAAGWDAFVADTGIPVLIDAAAAFGNQVIGERAHVAFSFHATKPFSSGEGGALVTRDGALAERVRRLSNFGFNGDLVEEAAGNAKMSEYAAAVGLAQWRRWPDIRARGRRLWHRYAEGLSALSGVRMQQGVSAERLPATLPATLVVELPRDASRVAHGLALAGIETRRWYWPPLHHHPAFAHCPRALEGGESGEGELPVTEALGRHLLGLPWFAEITPAQCAEVVERLNDQLESMHVG